MPILPWANVLDHPTDFFDPLLSTETIGNPEFMKPSNLQDLSAAIVGFQSSSQTHGLSIFRSKSDLADGLLRQRDRVVEENLDVALSTSSFLSQYPVPSPSLQVVSASDPVPPLIQIATSCTPSESELNFPHLFSSLSGHSPVETPEIPSLDVPVPSTDALATTGAHISKHTAKRKRLHKPEENSVSKNLSAGPRSCKPSKRARGLGYEELTGSDEERQCRLGKSSKRAMRRGAHAK